MRFFFNLDLEQLVDSNSGGYSTTPISALTLKRRDGAACEIVFQRGQANVTDLPGTMEIHVAAKEAFGGGLIIHSADFVWDAALEAWVGSIDTNTTELNTLFADEPDSIDLKFEVTFRLSGSSPWISSKNVVTLTVLNDVYVGGEGAPESALSPGDYEPITTAEAKYHRSDEAVAYSTTRQQHARDNAGLILNEQTLTDAATIAWDMALGYNAKVTLGGNRTLAAPTNAPFTGAEGFLTVIQDGTGSRTLALNAAFVPLGGVAILNPTAAAVSRFKWRYDGTNYILWRVSGPHIQTLTDATTVAWNLQHGFDAKVTLGGNRTLGNPTSTPDAGAEGHLTIIQDGTGSRTLALDTAYVALGGALVISPAAAAVSRFKWRYDGTSYILQRISSAIIQTLTDAATIAWDMQFGLNAKVTLGGNRTLGNPTNKPDAGASGFIVVSQDGTGSRTLGYDTDFDQVNGSITILVTASDQTLLQWFYDGTKIRIWKP